MNRRKRAFAALGLGLTAVALMQIPVFLFAEGETATHAELHLAVATGLMIVATAVTLAWRNPPRRLESLSRRALIATVSLLATAQLTEACGALAWKGDGATVRSSTLEVVHTAATVVSGGAMISVAVSGIAALGALAFRLGLACRRTGAA
jgi:hypothetical protein